MPHNGKSLTPSQRLAVQLIAQGVSIAKVSSQLQVDPATLSRWRRLPGFKEEINAALCFGEQESLDALRATRNAATDRLCALVASHDPKIALKAIEVIFSKVTVSSLSIPPRDPLAEREKDHWSKMLATMLDAEG